MGFIMNTEDKAAIRNLGVVVSQTIFTLFVVTLLSALLISCKELPKKLQQDEVEITTEVEIEVEAQGDAIIENVTNHTTNSTKHQEDVVIKEIKQAEEVNTEVIEEQDSQVHNTGDVDKIESSVINHGISVPWFMVCSFIMGLVIPRPRFIRVLF